MNANDFWGATTRLYSGLSSFWVINAVMTDDKIDFITRELQTKHNCHTIIFYGSRAGGDATEASDYDFLGIRETGEILRYARL
jgi:predicted nucleotidyltransferase